jgi:hypothetical protein
MLAREHLIDRRTRDDLETQYLVALMERDARIWAKHTQASLVGKEIADEPDEHQQTTNGQLQVVTASCGKESRAR